VPVANRRNDGVRGQKPNAGDRAKTTHRPVGLGDRLDPLFDRLDGGRQVIKLRHNQMHGGDERLPSPAARPMKCR
jgi:hypothetical protein